MAHKWEGFAKTPAAMSSLKDQFERRQPERIYLAYVCGVPREDTGTWHDMLVWDQDELRQKPLSTGKPAKTSPAKPATLHWRVAERFERASLLEIRLVTGKRNQIRIQAELHHHPLIGERMYRDGMPVDSLINFTRQALHAWKLALEHPVTRQKLRFEAPVPADLQALHAKLHAPAKPLDHLPRDVARRPVDQHLLSRGPKRRDR